MQKRCCTCKAIKDISEFSCNRRAKDGVQGQCKACAALYREEHKAEIAEYNRKYNKTDNGKAAKRRKNHKRRARGKKSKSLYIPPTKYIIEC